MNGIRFYNNEIGYRFIPKIACTSIKAEIFRFENGRQYDSTKDDGDHIHAYYWNRQPSIANCKHRIIIIRDPIKRFLSSYGNRVVHHKELSKDKLMLSDGALVNNIKIFNPNLSQFIDGFMGYRLVKSIERHTKPIYEWVDGDLSSFNHIYPLEKLSEFEILVRNITTRDFNIPRLQLGGSKHSVAELSKQQLDFLFDYYKDDYALLSDFYTVDTIWADWKKSAT